MIQLHRGIALEVLAEMPDSSVDSIVTDPPYGLSREPDITEVLTHWLAGDDYEHGGGGFMGKSWDSFVPGPFVWKECLRVLKPGGHLLCFAGSRTVDLMGMAIRLGGFEIRDQIQWLYGSGFPKSMNVSKAIDKAAGAHREVVGVKPDRWTGKGGVLNFSTDRPQSEVAITGPPATPEAKEWEGWGTALKPAHEPIIVARKPFKGTVASNVLAYGTGALNIDATRIATEGRPSRVADYKDADNNAYAGRMNGSLAGGSRADGETDTGRWPANVVMDFEAGVALDEQTGTLTSDGDSGGASRFFYCAKTAKSERNAGLPAGLANNHPTVKPVKLMEWLVKMVTPPGGTVLDPFCGSGTTMVAAERLGFDGIGIDRDDEDQYLAVARHRIRHASGLEYPEPETPTLPPSTGEADDDLFDLFPDS